jgi:hypothetical protein
VQTPVPDALQPTLAFLHRQCARNGGMCSMTQATIAKATRRSAERINIHIAELRKMGLVQVIRYGHYNSYTVVGVAAVATNEPPAVSVPGQMLRLMRRHASRNGGTCSLSRPAIAKAIGRGLSSVNKGMTKLRRDGLVEVASRRPGSGWGIYTVAAPTVPNARSHRRPRTENVAAVPAKPRVGRKRKPGSVTAKIAALLSREGNPRRVSFHQVKGCFPPDRVAKAKSDSIERRKIVKQANMVVRRLTEGIQPEKDHS